MNKDIKNMSEESFNQRIEDESYYISELATGYDVTFRVGKAFDRDEFIIAADIDKIKKEYDNEIFDMPSRFVSYSRKDKQKWSFTLFDFYITTVGKTLRNRQYTAFSLGKDGQFALIYPKAEISEIPNVDISSFFFSAKQIGESLYACSLKGSLFSIKENGKWEKILPINTDIPTEKRVQQLSKIYGNNPAEIYKHIQQENKSKSETRYYLCLDGFDANHVYMGGYSDNYKGFISHWDGKTETIYQTDYYISISHIIYDNENKIWAAGELRNSSTYTGKVIVGNLKDGFHKVYDSPLAQNSKIVGMVKHDNSIYVGYEGGIGYIDEDADKITLLDVSIEFGDIVAIDMYENVLWVMERKRLHRFENGVWETSTYKWGGGYETLLPK